MLKVKFLKDVSTHCTKCKGVVHTAKAGTVGEVVKARLKSSDATCTDGGTGIEITDLSGYTNLNDFSAIWINAGIEGCRNIRLCASCAIKDKCIEIV